MEGNVLKIVEAKARQSLSRSQIENYIIPDRRTGELVYNVEYSIKELEEDYFKDSNIQTQFVLYLNGPNSQAIKNSLNLPERLPYKFTDADEIEQTGFIDIVVVAVNK